MSIKILLMVWVAFCAKSGSLDVFLLPLWKGKNMEGKKNLSKISELYFKNEYSFTLIRQFAVHMCYAEDYSIRGAVTLIKTSKPWTPLMSIAYLQSHIHLLI